MELKKMIIVEGKSDKEKVQKLISEEIEIICTNGTINSEKLESLIDQHFLDDRDVYILTDRDPSGEKLRKQFRRELPEAYHIYVDKGQVAETPDFDLASSLIKANIKIETKFLLK